jgi:hypothetical protein
MSDVAQGDGPDAWEQRWLPLSFELEVRLAGVDGPECTRIVEVWQQEAIAREPQLTATIRNHAQLFKTGLLKCPTETEKAPAANAKASYQLQVPACLPIVAFAGLAVWWYLPAKYSLGHTRNIVTIAYAALFAYIAFAGWWRFRRENWRRYTCLGFASVLAARTALPPVTAHIAGRFSPDETSFLSRVEASLVPDSAPTQIALLVIMAVLVIVGIFAPREAPTAN